MVIGNQLFCYIGHEGQDLDPILTTVYAATHRTLYSLGMSWMVMACVYGYGGKARFEQQYKGRFKSLSEIVFKVGCTHRERGEGNMRF